MKDKLTFVCTQCGSCTPKWLGKCPECQSWNSIHEEHRSPHGHGQGNSGLGRVFSGQNGNVVSITDVQTTHIPRLFVGIGELDRVLGGGLVPGSFTLLAGEPGIGKSTLVLQALHCLAQRGFCVLYATGEESLEQIKLRADRLGTLSPQILLLNETNLATIQSVAKQKKPSFMVIDSIQTIFKPEIESAPGTVTQLRESAAELMHFAKSQGVATCVVGHVTKDGSVAGPKVLEHLVDVILQLEGDAHAGFRILRGIKNRFGSTGEIGVFSLTSTGLQDVLNPSEIFLSSDFTQGREGAAIALSVEGTRPLLVEVQALVGKTSFSVPRRVVSGLDSNRLSILTAVLEKRAGLFFGTSDIYAGIAGGLKRFEPALDLALAASLASSLFEKPLPGKLALFGEIGLTGEVRACSHALLRIAEAVKIGISTLVLPRRNYSNEQEAISKMLKTANSDIQLIPIQNVYEILELVKR